MNPVRTASIFLTLFAAQCALAQAPPVSKEGPCTMSRGAVRMLCPNGWTLLAESDRELTIGNYVPTPDTPKNVFGGPGKAWLTFSTLPQAYRDLKEWILAGTKVAPGSVETRLTVKNLANGEIKLVCLSSPERSGTLSSSYFFQIGKTPVSLELNYRAEDPRKEEYKAAILWIVENAILAK